MTNVFSPLNDQPHFIYRVESPVGDELLSAEERLPGVVG